MNWKPLTLSFNKELHDALQQLHHAAQFIAMAGSHLIPSLPDDSHTNMQFLANGKCLVGHQLSNGKKLALQLNSLTLGFIDLKGNWDEKISLAGKTKIQVYSELKNELASQGIDISNFKNELHYEIPDHKLNKDSSFFIKDKTLFEENVKYRYNAEIIIAKIAKEYSQASPVRVWPHHFDTWTFVELAHNENGELAKSIGLGWAIPDSMVNEPYYYLSFWTKNPNINQEKIKSLDNGTWMMPDWNGAILKHSEILSTSSVINQEEIVKSFYKQGIQLLIKHLRNS